MHRQTFPKREREKGRKKDSRLLLLLPLAPSPPLGVSYSATPPHKSV